MTTPAHLHVVRERPSDRDSEGSVGQLSHDLEPVSPDTPTDQVFARFARDPQLHSIAVVSGTEPVGLVSRYWFCAAHAERHGRGEAAGPISRHMDTSPLLVDEHVSVDELAEVVIEQGGRHTYDGFIVTHRGGYRGVGTGHALLRALTERRYHQMRHVAMHDGLTGLPNRLLFDDRLALAIATAERARTRLAVLYIDLDQFKHINLAHSDTLGDELLKRVAGRLRQSLRKCDTIARLGSDEFAILLPSIRHAEAARLVARKIVDVFTPAFRIDGADVCVSASIGVAVFPDDAASAQRLMRCADRAAAQAKQVRNTFESYREELGSPDAPSVCSYGSLRRAIEQRELRLVYQPQVDLTTGRICGVEALVRWPMPAGPQVPANEIIAVAESSGLMVPLAEWVLDEACRQMRAWWDGGVPLARMAVNVSGVQLRQHGLAAIVERTLRTTGLPPEALELELTESLIMLNEGTVLGTVHDLKDLGVRLSIDDFGTGYSSLSRLVQLPVDSLKLDRTFVEPLGSDERATLLASAVILMAHRLGLQVIAEGVETLEQLRTLCAHRCDMMQGYWFSRPVPPADVAPMVRAMRGMDERGGRCSLEL